MFGVKKKTLQIVHGRRYHRDRNRYEIVYTNLDQRLLKEFSNDAKKVFKVKPRVRTDENRIRTKRVFDHLKKLGGGSSYEWRITTMVSEATRKIILAWLRAFFDDESTVRKKPKRIDVETVNFQGLKGVKKLLRKVGIEARLYGPYTHKRWKYWRLVLNQLNAKKFARIVGSNHTSKKKKLKKLFLTKLTNKFTCSKAFYSGKSKAKAFEALAGLPLQHPLYLLKAK